MLIAAL